MVFGLGDKRALACTLFGTGALVFLGLDVAWWALKKYVLRRNQLPVNEVLVFNELGEECVREHYENDRRGLDDECSNRFCRKRTVRRITDEIDRAAYSVDIAIFLFTSGTIKSAILRALTRSVKVRLISDRMLPVDVHIYELYLCGVPMRGTQPIRTAIMHHKFIVVDALSRVQEILEERPRYLRPPFLPTLITGSPNWTSQGFGGNWESCIISRNIELVDKFQSEFSRLWKMLEVTKAP
ncbi:hypothetical protein KR018_003817, partial [Drosophila ironensis]